jgi:hypothetical protein
MGRRIAGNLKDLSKYPTNEYEDRRCNRNADYGPAGPVFN